jgi:hypothetical protein
MKKKFAVEKPTKDGDYWYYSHGDKKPRIAQWDNARQKFQGDADQYGPHTFCDPVYWAKIVYPK